MRWQQQSLTVAATQPRPRSRDHAAEATQLRLRSLGHAAASTRLPQPQQPQQPQQAQQPQRRRQPQHCIHSQRIHSIHSQSSSHSSQSSTATVTHTAPTIGRNHASECKGTHNAFDASCTSGPPWLKRDPRLAVQVHPQMSCVSEVDTCTESLALLQRCPRSSSLGLVLGICPHHRLSFVYRHRCFLF